MKLLQILKEIKINKPAPKFPMAVTKEEWDAISKQLDALGYRWDFTKRLPSDYFPPIEVNREGSPRVNADGKLYIYSDENKKLSWSSGLREIKINNPNPREYLGSEKYYNDND